MRRMNSRGNRARCPFAKLVHPAFAIAAAAGTAKPCGYAGFSDSDEREGGGDCVAEAGPGRWSVGLALPLVGTVQSSALAVGAIPVAVGALF